MQAMCRKRILPSIHEGGEIDIHYLNEERNKVKGLYGKGVFLER